MMGRAFYLAIYISHDGMLSIYCRLIICKCLSFKEMCYKRLDIIQRNTINQRI